MRTKESKVVRGLERRITNTCTGLAIVMRNGTRYLLGLCEGNNCEGGDDGKDPGKGTILVLEFDTSTGLQGNWQVVDQILLPEDLPYQDYSGIDVYDNEFIVVVSQSESSMWIGRLDDDNWTIRGGDNAGAFVSQLIFTYLSHIFIRFLVLLSNRLWRRQVVL